jgi:hypothetical protein
MIGWTTAIISSIWATLIQQSIFTLLREYMPEVEGVDWDQFAGPGTSLDFLLGLIIAPIAIIIGMFIASGIYHLFLLMVKGANKNFETTFNVVAYGMVAHIAEIIPFCGGLFAWVWGLVLTIIGLSEAHKTDSWKAVFAVFGPALLCCLCIALIVMAAGGAGFFSGAFDSL